MSWRGDAIIVALLTGLSACGFAPIYGEATRSVRVVDDLASIGVDPIPDRLGQQLRNTLNQRLAPQGRSGERRYRLSVRLRVRQEGLAIQKDETVTRFNFTLQARFVLRAVGAPEELFRGTTKSIAAYNVVESTFATLIAERDARTRAAGEVSTEIGNQLAVFFARRAGR